VNRDGERAKDVNPAKATYEAMAPVYDTFTAHYDC